MAASAFSVDMPIRFSHSDPAGIVYYPNYFDMFNAVIEDWFTQRLGVDYAHQILERRIGLPTVHAECDFFMPSRMGDRLTFTLLVQELGRSSIKLTIHGHVGARERLRAQLVLVVISLETQRSIPIPDDLRQRMTAYQADSRDWHLASETAIA
ncbi:MAG TPA: thioesterase family protein [Alphaproteobacteria bacterium]